MATNTPTRVDNPVFEEALAAYLQAQEDGQASAAQAILSEYPELADEIAAFFAFRARVPKPWRLGGDWAQGRQVGDFELLQELGRGGMGVVYKARDTRLNRLVAVKVMLQERCADVEDAERFRRDAELLASLHHPNIVQIYQAGKTEIGSYFAMELVDGGSLARQLAAGWLPTPTQAAELVRVLAEAIQHAHDANVVHRDVKPANVLLQIAEDVKQDAPPQSAISNLQSAIPKITDFGLAKKLDAGNSLTRTGAIVGTASYMAPEQAAGDSKHVGRAADIHALGAILYELLTGRPPFLGATLVETLDQVRNHEPRPVRQLCPSVPRDLETICLKCLCKKPHDRYSSSADLAKDLQSFLHDSPIQARSVTLVERLVRTVSQTGLLADFHAYSNAYVISGLVYFVAFAAVFLLCRTEGPEWLIWLVLFSPYVMLFGIFRQHRYPWSRLAGWLPDRQLWSIWIGHLLASSTMFLGFRLGGRDIYETVYIGFAVHAALTGLAFFIMGCDYWGRYYLFGLAWLAAAMLMALTPTWAPLEYAILAAMCVWHIAWTMRRLAREDRQTPTSATRISETISLTSANK